MTSTLQQKIEEKMKEFEERRLKWKKETLESGYETAFWDADGLVNGSPVEEYEYRTRLFLRTALTDIAWEAREEALQTNT